MHCMAKDLRLSLFAFARVRDTSAMARHRSWQEAHCERSTITNRAGAISAAGRRLCPECWRMFRRPSPSLFMLVCYSLYQCYAQIIGRLPPDASYDSMHHSVSALPYSLIALLFAAITKPPTAR